ncbi:hypothetical protein SAMN04488097_1112 [Epilithonimonas lactis]|nr:hypothetical protein SAMN04488097_1112 [Epilithonimonas lactis]
MLHIEAFYVKNNICILLILRSFESYLNYFLKTFGGYVGMLYFYRAFETITQEQ